MLKFTITPYDLLFFGDARPFDKGSDTTSVFPPFSHTIVSSIFAKLYHLRNIKYNEKPLINAVYGPFIEKNNTLYFPAPMDIMTDDKLESITILEPIYKKDFENSIIDLENTDLGQKISSLLWYKGESDKNIKPFKGIISLDGLKKWYGGETPEKENLLSYSDIYESEEHIGISIDNKTGTTQSEDGLYRVSFVRLKKDVSFVIWIDFNIENIDFLKTEEGLLDFYNTAPKVLKLGGEGKSVYYSCEIDDFKKRFNGFTGENSSGNVKKVLFLSYGIFEPETNNKNNIDYISGFLTGIIDKYAIAGINQKRTNIQKTVRAIKPGSVVYINNGNHSVNIIDFINKNDQFIGSNLVLID